MRVSEGEVINIHTMRRSDEEGRRKGGVWWREVVELTSLISIQYVIILCNDVTRACSGEIGQNLLTTHFLASLHVCHTIEGLRLAYYELLYKCLYKIDKRLVISIVLHQAWRAYTVKPRLIIYW
jgi:hypothetical protein